MSITNPRLIDANALIEKIKEHYKGGVSIEDMGLDIAINEIDSAPTVETTDDVLARLPIGCKVSSKDDAEMYRAWEGNGNVCRADTPLEALLSLEESLNRK